MRTILAAGLLSLSVAIAAPAFAAEAAPLNTTTTTIGALLEDPAAKAIVDKYMPGFSANPQVEMAKAMTFKQVQQYAPDQMSDAVLAKIDADLAKLPVKK